MGDVVIDDVPVPSVSGVSTFVKYGQVPRVIIEVVAERHVQVIEGAEVSFSVNLAGTTYRAQAATIGRALNLLAMALEREGFNG